MFLGSTLNPLLAHRRALIPMHKDLRLSGQLPPLDAPHHMRATEWGVFREGVVLSSAPGAGSLLDIGLDKVSVCQAPREWMHQGDWQVQDCGTSQGQSEG